MDTLSFAADTGQLAGIIHRSVSGFCRLHKLSGRNAVCSDKQHTISARAAAHSVERGIRRRFNEVKQLGAVNSTTRTADQTLTAYLWANPPVSDALIFNVARTTALARNNSTVENARLFALLLYGVSRRAGNNFHESIYLRFLATCHGDSTRRRRRQRGHDG